MKSFRREAISAQTGFVPRTDALNFNASTPSFTVTLEGECARVGFSHADAVHAGYQAHARNRTSARTPVRSVSRFDRESKPSAQARTQRAPTVRRPDTTAPVSSLPHRRDGQVTDRNLLFDAARLRENRFCSGFIS